MALASLCHDSVAQDAFNALDVGFTGYIVDHGIRRGSSDEAARVAESLQRLRVKPRILKIDWSKCGPPASHSNLETVARTLRYQALGRACAEDGIRSLLVAHHANDQAETVLFRICGKYTGAGLQGIQSIVRIPECTGIYGVDGSGMPWRPSQTVRRTKCQDSGMDIESGGVILHRPLLQFTKESLINICRKAGVTWFDDDTNADKGLTLRNTIRHILQADLLPTAMQETSLCTVSEHRRRLNEEVEQTATRVFMELPMELDLRQGKVTITIEPASIADVRRKGKGYTVLAVLLRQLIQLVSPMSTISLPDLDQAVELSFPDASPPVPHNGDRPQQVTVANVILRTEAKEMTVAALRTITIHRQNPRRQDIKREYFAPRLGKDSTSIKADQVMWSDWLLWDQRYWLRIGHRRRGGDSPQLCAYVSFLTAESLGTLRRSLSNESRIRLERALSHGSRRVFRTLPAIFVQTEDENEIIALPSIDWSREMSSTRPQAAGTDSGSELIWQIRYKRVDYSPSVRHSIVR